VPDFAVDLDSTERRKIYEKARELSPRELEGKVIFKVDSDCAALEGFANNFIEFSVASHMSGLVAVREGAVVFQGRKVRVTKVMIYQQCWIQDYYYHPMSKIAKEEGDDDDGGCIVC
jgi:hypothetical protein